MNCWDSGCNPKSLIDAFVFLSAACKLAGGRRDCGNAASGDDVGYLTSLKGHIKELLTKLGEELIFFKGATARDRVALVYLPCSR